MKRIDTDVERQYFSSSSNNIIYSTIKEMCIVEDAKCLEKITVEHDAVDKGIYSSSNLPRMNVRSVLMEDRTDNASSRDLKSSDNKWLGSSGKILELNVGDKGFTSSISTCLNETSEPVMNDLRSLIANGYLNERCFSGEANVRKIPTEEIIEGKTIFSQEFDTDILQLNSHSHDHSIDGNHDGRPNIDQVTEQDGKLATMASPMQAKESTRIEESVNKDLFEERKTYSITYTDIESNRFDNREGVSYDVKWETGDMPIAGKESRVVNNQENVQKRIGEAVDELISGGTTSARNSFARIIHDEMSCSGVSSLSGTIITSGHIQYSGNISHRSDSSTTSTHSFAFPILQPEWNSSPVKMAKADRRHLRKHRWRTVLICCKF